MTGYEKKAYECGRTYRANSAEHIAPCYDDRMYNLVCEARSKQGRWYNQRNLKAWWKGFCEANPAFSLPSWVKEDK